MVIPGSASRRDGEPRPWPEALRRTQRALGERLQRVLAQGGFDRRRYATWLTGEAGVAVLCADAMDALAGWHASEAALRSIADAWATELRGFARVAAADLRVLAEAPATPSPVLEEWRVFLAGASASQRAGEALGAIALHSRLLPGAADESLASLCGLAFARGASQYPARRRQVETSAVREGRDRLLDAYASAALAAGARRAAVWELDVINQTGIEA
jgi:hypothetical protein